MLHQKNILRDVFQRQVSGEIFALATVVRAVSPTAAKAGSKAMIFKDGAIEGWIGGGCAQPAVVKTALKCINDGQSRLIRVSPESDKAMMEGMTDFQSHCQSGGSLDIFIDPLVAEPHLRVYGKSPAAQSLVELAARTGFIVSVLSPEISSEQFPDAHRCIDGFEAEGNADLAVIATQGQGDRHALKAVLRSSTPYIALIASEKKGNALKESLIEKGFYAPRVNSVVCPAGVEIGAETPEEVALSVLASLVIQRRTGKPLAPSIKEENSATPDCCSEPQEPQSEAVTSLEGSCCGGEK